VPGEEAAVASQFGSPVIATGAEIMSELFSGT